MQHMLTLKRAFMCVYIHAFIRAYVHPCVHTFRAAGAFLPSLFVRASTGPRHDATCKYTAWHKTAALDVHDTEAPSQFELESMMSVQNEDERTCGDSTGQDWTQDTGHTLRLRLTLMLTFTPCTLHPTPCTHTLQPCNLATLQPCNL